MSNAMDGYRFCRLFVVLYVVTAVTSCGCTTGIVSRHSSLTRHSIPASRFPEELIARRRNDLVPIDLTLLQQQMPPEHLIGPDDILGISTENILEPEGQLPNVYWAAEDSVQQRVPTAGHPIRVALDGTIDLPYILPIRVAGMSLSDATEAVRKAYMDAQLLSRERERVAVTLIRPRSEHIVVIREDSGATRAIHHGTEVLSQRGSGDAIDLPAFKNDVLHALTATGGLPGIETFNEIWIFRRGYSQDPDGARIMGMIQAGEDPSVVIDLDSCRHYCLRIPLRVPVGYVPTFSPEDILLHDGDVVYVTSRQEIDYFLAGGLLNGGKYLLPRDRDADVFDAIAIASSSAFGPAGNNAAANNFRVGPGNIIPATRVIVIRKLETGEQVKIRVDLIVAANDPRERILIQPGDVVILQYKPSELLGNIALNIVNLNYVIPNR
jgi:protein involved in polysaccharide export with SLBB domain